MPHFLSQLLRLLTRREKIRFGVLALVIVVMALLEVVGIFSILPFMTLVARPETLQTQPTLRWLYETFGFERDTTLLMALGVGVLLLMFIANAFAVYAMWFQARFTWAIADRLSVRLMRGYLAEPYAFFLSRNPTDLAKNALGEVINLVTGLLQPALELGARALTALAILAMLVVVEARLALLMAGVLGGCYGLIYLARRRYVADLGEVRLRATQQRYRTVIEALTGVKTVKVEGVQGYFLRRFEHASALNASVHPRYQLVSNAPRYVVETLAFGGILMLVLYLLAVSGDVQSVLPMLSLFAFAGYRLMPSLQRMFAAATKLRHTRPVVELLYADLARPVPPAHAFDAPAEALPFAEALRAEAVTFRYQDEPRAVLHGIDLTIGRGTSVAFVGSTGSGKTTLIDLMMGLVFPETGTLWIDDVALTPETAPRWQRRVGYVPQEVFLYDATVAQNIAFGCPPEAIDHARVREVAALVMIDDFVMTELPDAYDTRIGERGVRLSGGQRQRLGLARALYRDPAVLVLDEATNALDGITEEAVVQALRDRAVPLTLIMIAHRLSTVKHCDCIFLLEDGRLVEQGTFAELCDTNPLFREMVKLTS